LTEDWRRLSMRFCAGRVKDDLDLVGMGEKAADSLGAGRQSQLACACQPFRLRNDADHQYRLQHGRALEFVEQIGADVARPDDGHWYFFCHTVLSCSGDESPSRSFVTLRVAPAAGQGVLSTRRCHWAAQGTLSPGQYRQLCQTRGESLPSAYWDL